MNELFTNQILLNFTFREDNRLFLSFILGFFILSFFYFVNKLIIGYRSSIENKRNLENIKIKYYDLIYSLNSSDEDFFTNLSIYLRSFFEETNSLNGALNMTKNEIIKNNIKKFDIDEIFSNCEIFEFSNSKISDKNKISNSLKSQSLSLIKNYNEI